MTILGRLTSRVQVMSLLTVFTVLLVVSGLGRLRSVRMGAFFIADRIYYGQNLPLATGDRRVDRLLKTYEQETGDRVTFPVIVLTAPEFAAKFRAAGSSWPFGGQEILTFGDPSDAFVGVCVTGSFYRRAIYLNARFVSPQENVLDHQPPSEREQDPEAERFLAKTLAHDLGHCRYLLDHSPRLTSIMYEDVSMSSTPREWSSVAVLIKQGLGERRPR